MLNWLIHFVERFPKFPSLYHTYWSVRNQGHRGDCADCARHPPIPSSFAQLRSDHVITILSAHWRTDKHNYLCITHNPHSAHSLQTNFHITATNIIEILNDWFQNPLWIQSKSSEISNTWHLNQSLLNRIAEIIDVIAWDEPHSSHSLSCLQDRAVNSLQK